MPATGYTATPSISRIIDIAKVSQYLAMRDTKREQYTKGGSLDSRIPVLIYMVRKAVEWKFNTSPGESTLPFVAYYLYDLCGKWIAEAVRRLGGNGIVVDPTTGQPFGFEGYREDFTVGEAGALMFDGDDSLYISLPGFIRKTVHFEPSGVDLTISDNTQFSCTIEYNPTYVFIQLNQPVQNGQRFTVWGLRAALATGVGTSGGGGGGTPVPKLRGKFLSNDGSKDYWTDPFIEITNADFETDGKTYINTDLADNEFAVLLNDLGRFLDPEEPNVEFTRIESGGVIINLPDFDATTKQYTLKIFKRGRNA